MIRLYPRRCTRTIEISAFRVGRTGPALLARGSIRCYWRWREVAIQGVPAALCRRVGVRAPVAAPWTSRLASLCCIKIFISNLAEESAHKTSLKNSNGTL